MRSFTGNPNDLEEHGPMIKVKIVAPQNTGGLLPNGEAAPSVEALALIDTGADTTSIPYGTAKQLGLTSVGEIYVTGFSTPKPRVQDTYRVRLLLPNAEGEITASEEIYEDSGVPYKCVIGRDLLKYGVLFYDGTNNSFSLTL